MITLKNISKSWGEKKILHHINFSFPLQQILSIVGKSGCGKTTLLKILSGMEIADEGAFHINQQDMFALPAHQRDVVYISQHPLLFPHLNTFENIAFGLSIRKMKESLIEEKVTQLLHQLQLSEQAKQMPETLSGGQQQRVAFGRAIIIEPKLLLLDEPFTGLDHETRQEMRALYKTIASAFKISAIWVTHDMQEAILMGDTFAFLENTSFKSYDSKESFINDNYELLKSEIDFWNALKKE